TWWTAPTLACSRRSGMPRRSPTRSCGCSDTLRAAATSATAGDGRCWVGSASIGSWATSSSCIESCSRESAGRAGAISRPADKAAPHGIAAERKQLVRRDAEALEREELLSRSVEGCDDHQVVRDLLVITHRRDRYPQELPPSLEVEDRDRLEAEFPEGQIGQLRGLAAAEDRDAAIGGRAFPEDGAQVAAHFAVEVQRIIDEFVRQPRFFGDPAGRNQIRDAVRPDVHALDEALS